MTLHEELVVLRKKEKQLGIQILEKLQTMEDCRGYLSLGYSNLFDYLVRGLGYSESAAYQKQSCLRLAKQIPEIKEKLKSGALSTSGLSLAFKTLKTKSLTEKRELLAKIEHQPTRNIKKLLVQEEIAPPIRIQKTEYQDKVILRLELSIPQNQKLERLKKLKSHKGGIEQLLEELIDQSLKKYENTTFKASRSKNPRFISQTSRNHVLKKAKEQCQYPGCGSQHFLQVDHIIPVRRGGRAISENLQTLCASHNRFKG